MEKYSEGKINMSEPESGNGNVSTVYFVNQAREILESVARSLFTMNEHAIANVHLDLSFLNNVHKKYTFTSYLLRLNVTS